VVAEPLPLTPGREIQSWVSLGRDYEECIGAKKHLVVGMLFHAGERSNSFAVGPHRGKVQRWKRSSGDGIAMSAGIISSVLGR
jgi:hypothetical protein